MNRYRIVQLILILRIFCADAFACDAMENKTTLKISRADLKLSIYKDIIVGGDVVLIPVFPEHSIYLYDLFANQEAIKHYGYGKVKTAEEVDNAFTYKAVRNLNEAKTIYYLIVTHYGAAGQLSIGETVSGCAQELSYGISPQFGRRGIATNAAKAAMDFVGGSFYATVHPENVGSIGVLKKLGFKKDASRTHIPQYNSLRDYYVLDSFGN